MDEVKEAEKRTEELKAENEELDQELSRAQKKALIKEAKDKYGTDWKKIVGGAVKAAGKLRVNQETIQTLHSMGVGGSELRNLSNPQYLQRRK